MTLIAIRHLQIDGHVFYHSQEIMPGLLAKETIDKLVDQGRIQERPRRSLYGLLHTFSGCTQTEPLAKDLQKYALTE